MIANIEAEQQLLGAILTDNAVYHLVRQILTGEHFADPVHRRIFEICATGINAEKLASPVTLKTLMDGDDGLKALGGPAYLARLAGSAMAVRAAKDYAGHHHRRLAALGPSWTRCRGRRKPSLGVAGIRGHRGRRGRHAGSQRL